MTAQQRAFACQHLGLAHQQARRFARCWAIPVEELLSPAYEGLCKGAIGFDARRDHRPSTYLVAKVKGSCCTTCATPASCSASATACESYGSAHAGAGRRASATSRSPIS